MREEKSRMMHGEVSEHFIGAPATKEVNCVRVDMVTAEGHGAGGK